MNPVDHPHGGVSFGQLRAHEEDSLIICSRVTINISERHPPSPDTLSRDKRPVSLLLAEPVCSVVLRRSRIKRCVIGISYTFGQAGFALCTFNGARRGRNKDFKKGPVRCSCAAVTRSIVEIRASNSTVILCKYRRRWRRAGWSPKYRKDSKNVDQLIVHCVNAMAIYGYQQPLCRPVL